MKFILAKKQHLDGITSVWREFMDYHKKIDPFFSSARDAKKHFQKYLLEQIDKDDAHVLAVLIKKEVIAYSISRIEKHPPVFKEPDYGLISELAVLDAYQRQGVGEKMLDIVFEWFEANNISRIELKVASDNEVAYSFWEKHGFMDYMHVLYLNR